MNELVDRRILSAFRCVDAITGNAVQSPLNVNGTGWTLRANRSGIFVVFDGPQLEPLTTQFIPTLPWPPATPFEVTIADPALQYLPRRASVTAPAVAPAVQSINVYRGPAAPTSPNWTVVRASVVRAGTTQGLPWTVLQLVNASDHSTLATSVADVNGEALLAVAGLKLRGTQTVAVTIQAWFDPTNSTQPASWTPNPDDILTNLSNPNLKSATQSAQLAVGQELAASIPISL